MYQEKPRQSLIGRNDGLYLFVMLAALLILAAMVLPLSKPLTEKQENAAHREEWRQLGEWQSAGQASKETETFFVGGTEWRIRWKYTPTPPVEFPDKTTFQPQDAFMIWIIRDTPSGKEPVSIAADFGKSGEGETMVHSEGNHHLMITSTCAYTVIADEYR